MRKWVQDRVDFETPFRICFYTGSYSDTFCSIMPVGDITSLIPDEEVSRSEPHLLASWVLAGIVMHSACCLEGCLRATPDCGRLQAIVAALCCGSCRVLAEGTPECTGLQAALVVALLCHLYARRSLSSAARRDAMPAPAAGSSHRPAAHTQACTVGCTAATGVRSCHTWLAGRCGNLGGARAFDLVPSRPPMVRKVQSCGGAPGCANPAMS